LQSRKASAIEAIFNIVIGMGVALGSQYLVFPIVGIENVSHATHIYITLWFTAISFIRSYIIRRWFTTRMNRLIKRIAGE
jgi:hypothetical protein